MACLKPSPCWTHSSLSWMTAQLQHSTFWETSLLPPWQIVFSTAPSWLQVLILFFKNSSQPTSVVLLPAVCSSLLAVMSYSVGITDSHTSSLWKSLSSSKPLLNFLMDKNLPFSYQKSIQMRTWVSSWQSNLSLKNFFFFYFIEVHGKICFFFLSNTSMR